MNYAFWFRYFLKHGLIAFSFLIFEVFLIDIGELDPKPIFLESLKTNEEIIIGQSIYDDMVDLKLEAVRKLDPEIISIGNSRVNSFRANMFTPYSFYNLSRTTNDFMIIKSYLELLKDLKNLKVVIVNLQVSRFSNSNGQKFKNKIPNFSYNDPYKLFKKKLIYLKKNQLGLKSNFPDNFGINRRNVDRGIRALDGSVHGGKQHNISLDAQIARKIKLENRKRDFSNKPFFKHLDSKLNPEAIEAFKELVEYANSRNISVVAITPPYSKKIINMLEGDHEKFELWHTFQEEEFQLMFRDSFGYYFNYSRHSDLGSSPLEMMDHIHPSEKICARMLIRMMQDQKFNKLLPKIDTHELKKRIEMTELPLLDIFSNKN